MTQDSEKRFRSAAIYVLGCKVNQAEADGMKQMLAQAGCRICGQGESPDVVIVNTCCVTSKAEGKSRRLVNRLSRIYPQAMILATGCLAEIHPSSFDASDGRVLVFPRSARTQLKDVLAGKAAPCPRPEKAHDVSEFVDFGIAAVPSRTRGFIKIQDGCSARCSYCIVPKARGPARSLRVETVLGHVETMASSGAPEIVLSGVNLGAYGTDLIPPVNLEGLLRTLLSRESGPRFRLSSLEPERISPGIIDLMASHDRLCRHLHIPLQSGDDRILRLMNRPYHASFMQSLVKTIFSKAPEACIGFDVIVGFPGESEEAFEHTVQFIEECGVSYLHVFPFSSRPETPAAALQGRIPDSVTRTRVDILRQLSARLRAAFFERCLGKAFSVVVESGPDPLTGHLLVRTDNYIPVYCPATPRLLNERKGVVALVDLKDGRVFGREA
ncbi:MAG: tRNA (N(6)-L-threonylcarbamoyladenosine(37)-C(2))-methylthiotransferase MtaB [Desulfomonilaceae bacterium]